MLASRWILPTILLLLISGCGRVRVADFGLSSASNTPVATPQPGPTATPSGPGLNVVRLNTNMPTAIVSGVQFTEVLEISNPSPSVPLTLTGVSDNPIAQGAELNIQDCLGVTLLGATTCRAYIRYLDVSAGDVLANPSFDYEFVENGITYTDAAPHSVQMSWATPASGLSFSYSLSPFLLTENEFPHSMTPPYSYTDPYGSIDLKFVPKDLSTVPAGVAIDSSSGRISGKMAPGHVTVPVCMMRNGTLTQVCSNAVLRGESEPVISAGASPCAGMGVAGDGSSTSPYQISTAAQFRDCIRLEPSKAYLLTGNIDFNSFVMDPIPSFSGSFDGQGFTLSNYSFTDALPTTPVGLFRSLTTGSIVKNLVLHNFYINSPGTALGGVLAGAAQNSLISNITIRDSTVIASYGIGGLIGVYTATSADTFGGGAVDLIKISNTLIRDSDSAWSVAGGAIGIVVTDTLVKFSRISVTLLSTSNMGNTVGGIIGASQIGHDAVGGKPLASLWLDGAVSTGTLSGAEFVGGIIGFATEGDQFSNVGSLATLSSTARGGGLFGGMGGNSAAPTLKIALGNSYFAGSVAGIASRGRILGDAQYRSWGGQVVMTGVYVLSSIPGSDQVAGNASTIAGTPPVPYLASQLQDPDALPFWGFPWVLVPGVYPRL